ncbi:hypothetical protein D3C87_1639350 [compost metagenome]
MKEITIEFVAFIDEIFTCRIKFATRAKTKCCSNRITDRNIQLLQCPDKHARGGCFAMGAGNRYEFEILFGDDVCKKFIALSGADTKLAGKCELGMIIG